MNECVDFTFEHVWEGEGDWSDAEKYIIEVPGGESWKMAQAAKAQLEAPKLEEKVITFGKRPVETTE